MLYTDDGPSNRCHNCLRCHRSTTCYYCGVNKETAMTANQRKNVIKDRAKLQPPVTPASTKKAKDEPTTKKAPAPVVTDEAAPLLQAKFTTEGLSKKQAKELKAEAEKVGAVEEKSDMLSVSDVARECKVDPKAARARLRKARGKAAEGRWPKVKRDSDEHLKLVGLLTGDMANE